MSFVIADHFQKAHHGILYNFGLVFVRNFWLKMTKSLPWISNLTQRHLKYFKWNVDGRNAPPRGC